MKRKALCCFLTLLLFGVGSHAPAAVTIINADFEGGSPEFVATIPGWNEIDTVDVIIPGGLPVDLESNGTIDLIVGQGAPASPNGGQFVSARNVGVNYPAEGVSQMISGLIIGLEYELFFYQTNTGMRDFRSGFSDTLGSGFWEVSFGTEMQQSPFMVFEGHGQQTWELITLNFTASSTDQILTFRGRGSGARLGLDGVSMVPVPEPSTPLFFSFVFILGLFGCRRFLGKAMSYSPKQSNAM